MADYLVMGRYSFDAESKALSNVPKSKDKRKFITIPFTPVEYEAITTLFTKLGVHRTDVLRLAVFNVYNRAVQKRPFYPDGSGEYCFPQDHLDGLKFIAHKTRHGVVREYVDAGTHPELFENYSEVKTVGLLSPVDKAE